MQRSPSHLGLPNFIPNHPDWRAENGQSLSSKNGLAQVKTAPNEAYTRIGKMQALFIHIYPHLSTEDKFKHISI
jgi:hypothetical protein